MAGPSPEWGFGMGGAAIVLAAGATWAAIHLRINVYERLIRLIRKTRVALDAEIIAEARGLRKLLNEYFSDSPNIDPAIEILEPSRIVKPALVMARDYKMRERINSDFEIILKLATALAGLAPLFLLTSLAATFFYFVNFENSAIWVSLTVAATGEALVSAAAVAWYGVLRSRTQAAVEAGRVEP